MTDYGTTNKEELTNTLAALIKAVNKNTNVIEQYVTQVQDNDQVQASSDRTNIRDVGSNKVNVINYIDPDTFSGALSSNQSYIDNLAAALSESISATLIVQLTRLLQQAGLINIAE